MDSGPEIRPASWGSKKTYYFDRFELDMARFELREEGTVQSLEPQVFNLLAYLIEHRERLVPKHEIFEKLWDGRVVTDSALTSRIKSARQVLGDSGKAQQFIRTIYGKGFRFIADVRFAEAAGAGPISIIPPCLSVLQSVEISLSTQHCYTSPGPNWRRKNETYN